MKVTQEILTALEKLQKQTARELGKTDTRGCLQVICKKTGLSSNYLYRIKLGQNISEENWGKLFPMLRPYLSNQFNPIDGDNKCVAAPPSISSLENLQDAMTQLAPNAQHVVAGIINVYGVPVERVRSAIQEVIKDQPTRDELIQKIFGV